MYTKSFLNGTASPQDFRELKSIGWTVAQLARRFKISEHTVRHAMRHETGTISVRPTCIDMGRTFDDRKAHDCTPIGLYKAVEKGEPYLRTWDDIRATRQRQFIDCERKKGSPEWLIAWHLKHLSF